MKDKDDLENTIVEFWEEKVSKKFGMEKCKKTQQSRSYYFKPNINASNAFCAFFFLEVH